MTPGKSKNIDGFESAFIRSGCRGKLQEVFGQPLRIRFMIAAPSNGDNKVIGFGMDVTVVSITCENNEDSDRVRSSVTPPPNVGHDRQPDICPNVADAVPGVGTGRVEVERAGVDTLLDELQANAGGTDLLNASKSRLGYTACRVVAVIM